MSLAMRIQVVVQGIHTAYDRDDWDAAERLSERVRALILDGVVDRDRDGLSQAAAELETAYTLFCAGGEDIRKMQVRWTLRSDAALAKLAARRTAPQRTPLGAEDRSARDRILNAMLRANGPLAVNSVATIAGVVRETASRYLADMADEGLIRTRKVGRKSLSTITAKGRAAAGEAAIDIAEAIRNVHTADIKPLFADAPPASQLAAQIFIRRRAVRTKVVDVTLFETFDAAGGGDWLGHASHSGSGAHSIVSGADAPSQSAINMIFNHRRDFVPLLQSPRRLEATA